MAGSGRKLPVVTLAALLTVVLVACGGEEEPSASPTDGGEGGEPTDAGDGSADGEWEPEWVDGVLQPLPDGFPSERLTIVVADDPTSPDAIFAQDLQRVADGMAPVNVEIEVREDFTAYGTWEALQYVSEQTGGDEGYHQVVLFAPGGLVDLHTAPVIEDLGFGLDGIKPVIGVEDSPYVLIQCADDEETPWGDDVEALAQYTRDNPGEVRYMAGGPGSGLDVAYLWWMKQENLDGGEVNMIPGGSSAERATAVAACEGQVTATAVEIANTHTQSGRVDVIMVGRDQPLEEWDAPTAADLGMDDPWGVTKELAVPGSVPDQHVRWLFELYRGVAESDEYAEARARIPGVFINVRDPEETVEYNSEADAAAEEVIRDIGIHVDQ